MLLSFCQPEQDLGVKMSNSISLNDQERHWTAEKLCRSSYKDLGNPDQVEDRFLRHLLGSCQTSLKNLLCASSTTTRDFSLEIDTFDLLEDDPVLGHFMLRYPSTLLPLLGTSHAAADRIKRAKNSASARSDDSLFCTFIQRKLLYVHRKKSWGRFRRTWNQRTWTTQEILRLQWGQ